MLTEEPLICRTHACCRQIPSLDDKCFPFDTCAFILVHQYKQITLSYNIQTKRRYDNRHVATTTREHHLLLRTYLWVSDSGIPFNIPTAQKHRGTATISRSYSQATCLNTHSDSRAHYLSGIVVVCLTTTDPSVGTRSWHTNRLAISYTLSADPSSSAFYCDGATCTV